MDKLLNELNKQFKKHGIGRIEEGAIIDAGIVDSPHAPTGGIVIEVAEDREEPVHKQQKTKNKPISINSEVVSRVWITKLVGYAKERLIVMAIRSMF